MTVTAAHVERARGYEQDKLPRRQMRHADGVVRVVLGASPVYEAVYLNGHHVEHINNDLAVEPVSERRDAVKRHARARYEKPCPRAL